tara:strand:- start:99 stop:467 length:369 start_codon:yes stop_codon:yes gene_type:complete
MSFTYKKVTIDPKINKEISIIRSDGWCIPFDEANTMYQEYLEWVAAGNTAEAADGLTWNDIRSQRDDILRETDWTMTPGATVDQGQWAAYRQVIRDIPQTYKDKTPDDVVWPTQPSTAGPNS